MNEWQQANAIADRLRGRPARAREAMSSRAGEVLAFLREFHAAQDQLPPLSEIKRHFGWASLGAAQWHMERLERAGAIERNAVGKYRFFRGHH